MFRIITASFLALTLYALPAFAMDPIPGEERFEGLQEGEDSKDLAATIGYAKIGGDHFIAVTPSFELNLGTIGLGLQIPLNLRVYETHVDEDGNDVDHDDYYGAIRHEDWDEPAEFLRAIRYFRYGHKRDQFYGRIGVLAAEIGHGTIMSRYMNNIDPNVYHLGVQLDLNTDYGGIETIISDIAFPDEATQVVGGRVYVKPVALADPDSIFNIFQLGGTVIVDRTAPFQDDDQDGTYEERAAVVGGLDFEIDLLSNAIIDLTPYTDLNFIQKAGWGWHAGIMAKLKMPVGFNLVIPARIEYRRFRNDYIPQYFSTFYEVERLDFQAKGPKNFYVRQQDGEGGINGYYGDLAFDFAGLLQFGAIYEDYEGFDPNLAAFVNVPALDIIQLKAFYTRTGITGWDDVMVFDDRSMAVAEARYELFMYTYLVGRYTRQWERVETTYDDPDSIADPAPQLTDVTFEPSEEWKVGIEFSLSF